MKLTIATLKETEEMLKNEPFRIVTPRRSRKYIERLRIRREEEASQKETKKKE